MTEKIHLDRAHLHQLWRQMQRIRRFEAKCVELYQAQKIRGFLHLYDGEEAVAVGVASALDLGRDAAVATYREHAIVGGGLPLAAGIALADKRLRPGRVTACFFGEGAVGEGVFHETMNLAALWRLPLLFVCENNLYAMGVPLADSEVQTDIWRKAQAYRMPAEQVDGMDPVQVEAAARRAAEHVRRGAGPFFIEARTYRFRAHSMFDTQAYRTRDEVEGWRRLDPIERLRAWMAANHTLDDPKAAAIEREVDAEIDAAVAGTLEPVEDLERFVLMDEVVQERAA